MKQMRLLLVLITALLNVNTNTNDITFTCDPYWTDRTSSSDGSGREDYSSYTRSETHDTFNDTYTRDSAVDSQRERYQERTSGYEQPVSTPALKKEPPVESTVTKLIPQTTQLRANGSYSVIEVPPYQSLSNSARTFLRNFGFHRLIDYPIDDYLSNEQKSLHGWINHTINLLAEMYKGPNNFVLKLVIKEITILVVAAHDLLVHGQIRKAEDLIKLANVATRKFDQYRQILFRAQFRQGIKYVKRPIKIIEDPVEGFAYTCILLGKTIVETARLTVSSDARTDLYNYITSLPQRAADLGSEIYYMSAEEWDETAKKSLEALGELSVDMAMNALLIKGLSSVFMPLDKVGSVSYSQTQDIVKQTQHSTKHLNLVFDHAKQAYVVEEFLAPLTAENTREMIQKGLLYDPEIVANYLNKNRTNFPVAAESISCEAVVVENTLLEVQSTSLATASAEKSASDAVNANKNLVFANNKADAF